MEIKQIAYVLEVAKRRSFSKAAEMLFVSQPAISKQILALEEELNIKIFKRDTHGVALTPDGERFCSYGKDVIESMDKLMEAFQQNTSRDKAVIRIGIFPFYKTAGLVSVINGFFASNHNVIGSVKVIENYQGYEMLENGDLDFIIIKGREENIPLSIKFDILKSEKLCALIHKDHPNAQKEILPVKALGEMPLLTGDIDSHYYNEMKELYEKNNINFNVAFMNTNETDIMMEMVKANAGILLVTQDVGAKCSNENVTSIPLDPPQTFVTIIASLKKRKEGGVYLAFKKHIIQHYNAER